MQPITIFRGTSGLNTVADPARIPMTKSSINDVAEIVNMRFKPEHQMTPSCVLLLMDR
jgi:hypothetical protein